MCFRHEWRRIIGGELFVFFVKFGILVGLPKCLLDNIDTILRRARRKDERLAGNPEGPLHYHKLALPCRFGKALKLRHLGEIRMFFPFGNFNHRMKVHQTFFDPIRVSLHDSVCAGCPCVNFTAH